MPPVAVRFIVLPMQTGELEVAVAVGTAFTVTDAFAVPEQPPLPVIVTV